MYFFIRRREYPPPPPLGALLAHYLQDQDNPLQLKETIEPVLSSQATEGMDFLSSENMDESVGLSFPEKMELSLENDLSSDSRHGSLGLSCPMTALMNLRDYLAK